MDSKTVLAISRLASTLDVESAKADLGPGIHKIEDTITIAGEVSLGEKYFTQDTAISWQTVVGYLLANMGENRGSVRRKLINAIKADRLAELDCGLAKKQKKTFKKSVAKAKGHKLANGKLTGKVVVQ